MFLHKFFNVHQIIKIILMKRSYVFKELNTQWKYVKGMKGVTAYIRERKCICACALYDFLLFFSCQNMNR